MNLFSIPGLNGYKAALSGWGLIFIGAGKAILALAALVTAIGTCLAGQITLAECAQRLPDLLSAVMVALAGLGVLGIGHKAQILIDNTPGADPTPVPAP